MTTNMVQGCRCPFNHQQFPLCDLHAAAPALLAALQEIRAALAHAHAWTPTMPRHLMEIADTALTQAEGRTP